MHSIIQTRYQEQSQSAAEFVISRPTVDITELYRVAAALLYRGFCLTDVFGFSDYITSLVNKHKMGDIIYQDCREAFDTEPSRRTIYKVSRNVGRPLVLLTNQIGSIREGISGKSIVRGEERMWAGQGLVLEWDNAQSNVIFSSNKTGYVGWGR